MIYVSEHISVVHYICWNRPHNNGLHFSTPTIFFSPNFQSNFDLYCSPPPLTPLILLTLTLTPWQPWNVDITTLHNFSMQCLFSKLIHAMQCCVHSWFKKKLYTAHFTMSQGPTATKRQAKNLNWNVDITTLHIFSMQCCSHRHIMKSIYCTIYHEPDAYIYN